MTALTVTRDGSCWTLAIDRPQAANALSADVVELLLAAVREAPTAGAEVLVLRGLGRNFSAGFDFSGIEQESDASLLRRFVRIEQLLQAVAGSRCLTIGLAHGASFGAGVDLLAACRWRVGDPAATFRMPGLAFCIVLGTRRFAATVGRERALAILEGAQAFDASAAHGMGFLRSVTAQDQWESVIRDGVETAARLPAASRAALAAALEPGLDEASLADLILSAAEPGLQQRMLTYRIAQQASRQRLATKGA